MAYLDDIGRAATFAGRNDPRSIRRFEGGSPWRFDSKITARESLLEGLESAQHYPLGIMKRSRRLSTALALAALLVGAVVLGQTAEVIHDVNLRSDPSTE
jgi:hypothetical protein